MRDLSIEISDKDLTNGAAQGSLSTAHPALAPIEFLPKWLLCVPLVTQWMWLGLRYRTPTLPSVLNPDIKTGGLAGESKMSYLAPIDPRLRAWVADTFAVKPREDPVAIRRRNNLAFPLVAKPDIGWCGYGVRRIDSEEELAAYGREFPSDAVFLLQRFAHEKNEAGILYVREARAASGRVSALTVRHAPCVVGDGRHSVADLIADDLRTQRNAARYALSAEALARVPEAGERVLLTTVASVRVGGRYEDLTRFVTPALDAAVDAIARSIGDFHYGRFDVKFESLADLQAGRFTIIEINGAGSEAIQFLDPRLSLKAAFAGVFAKQRALFALAHEMRKLGHKPVTWHELAAAWIRQQRLIRHYPKSN